MANDALDERIVPVRCHGRRGQDHTRLEDVLPRDHKFLGSLGLDLNPKSLNIYIYDTMSMNSDQGAWTVTLAAGRSDVCNLADTNAKILIVHMSPERKNVL